jgi:hypothetical protein
LFLYLFLFLFRSVAGIAAGRRASSAAAGARVVRGDAAGTRQPLPSLAFFHYTIVMSSIRSDVIHPRHALG